MKIYRTESQISNQFNSNNGRIAKKRTFSCENAWKYKPKKETKPVDYSYGPFVDNFSEKQHKYGPFNPIQEAKNKK